MACDQLVRCRRRTSLERPVTVQPAAFLWPPPPKRLATAPTSIAPFDRRLTRYSLGASISLKKTTAWISLTVSGRLISPSVSS